MKQSIANSTQCLDTVCAFKLNTSVKELYLGENNLSPSDGAHLYQLITGNATLELLDLRHNRLQVSKVPVNSCNRRQLLRMLALGTFATR